MRSASEAQESSSNHANSAPPFLSTLSPRKSAATSVTTTDGVVATALSASQQLIEAQEEQDRHVLEGRPDLSRRIGSAMNSLVLDGDQDDLDDESGDSSQVSQSSEQEKGAQSKTIIVARSSERSRKEDNNGHKETGPSVPIGDTSQSAEGDQPTPNGSEETVTSPVSPASSSAWTTWTSKAANGSLSLLRNSTSAVAGAATGSASWAGSIRVTNMFRPNTNASENTAAEGDGQSQSEAGPSKLKDNLDPGSSKHPTSDAKKAVDSDEDDAKLIRSAAASLRKGAKDEEKRRRAQTRQAQLRTGENPTQARKAASSSPASRLAPPDNTGDNSASASETRTNSPAPASSTSAPMAKNYNVFDYQGTLPGSSAPPSNERFPERRYFVLTQAGKPVFLSHLAARRLAREEEARKRLKSLREGKRRRQEWSNAEGKVSDEVRKVIEEEESRADRDEEEAKKRDALESDRDEEDSAVQVGVLQALVSNYSSQGVETLERKSIEILELPKESSRVVFLLREPLYLAVTSTWHDAGEIYADTMSLLKTQLEILHAGLISLISESQLQRLFARGFNFDLRRMLEGTDGILSSLVTRFQEDFGLLLGGGGGGVCLRPTRMDLKLREDIGSCLSLERWENRSLSSAVASGSDRDVLKPRSESLDPSSLTPSAPRRPKDLLYVLLVSSEGQLITMLRPRKLSAYPLDLHLLLNTINGMSRKSSRESGTVNWIPICLPRFAPQGMVQAHVSWLHGEQSPEKADSKRMAECALVIVTVDRESFEEISQWRDGIVSALKLHPSPLHQLSHQLSLSSISPDSLHLPGLRHFVLKKKDDLQIISSEWIDIYSEEEEDGQTFDHQLARERVRRCYIRGRELSILAAKKRKQPQPAPSNEESIESTRPIQLTPRRSVYTHYFQTPFENIYIDCPPPSAFKSSSMKPSTDLGTTTTNTTDDNSTSFFNSLGLGNQSLGPYELYLTLSPHVPPHTARKIAAEVLKWGLGYGVQGRERWRIWMGRGSVF
ncbi:unnamed protein product [Sympodiomycopsis kandeliae]